VKEKIDVICSGMTYRGAHDALMGQCSVARAAWGNGEWSRLAVASHEFDLPYQIQVAGKPRSEQVDGDVITLRFFTARYEPHFYQRGADEKYRPWVPSIEDIIATDWQIVEVYGSTEE